MFKNFFKSKVSFDFIHKYLGPNNLFSNEKAIKSKLLIALNISFLWNKDSMKVTRN